MTKHHYILIALSVIAGISCNRENAPDCFQTAGDITTVRRDIAPFTLIDYYDYIQLELVDTNQWFVEITAPTNLIPEIVTESTGGVLTIRNDNQCNWVRSFKNKIIVRIGAPEFTEIENHGTGDIRSVNILTGSRFTIENRHSAGLIDLNVDMDTLSLYMHTGVSDANLRGSVHTAEIFNQGLGLVHAENLASAHVYCNNSSINDIYVRASEYLYAYIRFSGNIFYSGSPSLIDLDNQGTGELIDAD
ncbi:MAG: hypothetical protein RL220_858 [Bacteroidota bacterium]